MTDSWWNASYSIRRNLNIVNTTSTGPIPEGNPIYIVLDFLKLNSLNKIRSDFDDLEVLFWDEEIATPAWTLLPRETIYDYNTGELTVVFNTVYEIQTEDTSNYFLYYTNPSLEGRIALEDDSFRPEYESAIYAQVATPQNGGIMFSRPTEDWLDGVSLKNNARAAFAFYGSNISILFEKGSDRGIVEVSVDGEVIDSLDTYSNITLQEYIYTLELDVAKHYVRFRVTGDKNPSSSDSIIKIVRIDYSKFFDATLDTEEIFSSNSSFTLVIGV